MTGFVVKDSGARKEFASGMRRDTDEDKTMWSLVADGPMLERYAEHLTKGAVKYSARNWMLADGPDELERFRESAFRHFMQWYNGDRDEDHASAVWFNINGAEYVKDKLMEVDKKVTFGPWTDENPYSDEDAAELAEGLDEVMDTSFPGGGYLGTREGGWLYLDDPTPLCACYRRPPRTQ